LANIGSIRKSNAALINIVPAKTATGAILLRGREVELSSKGKATMLLTQTPERLQGRAGHLQALVMAHDELLPLLLARA
jgi:hypothetical protein